MEHLACNEDSINADYLIHNVLEISQCEVENRVSRVLQDVVTGIASITNTQTESPHIYTLDGRRLPMGTSVNSLPRGVYIVNGKKVVK